MLFILIVIITVSVIITLMIILLWVAGENCLVKCHCNRTRDNRDRDTPPMTVPYLTLN